MLTAVGICEENCPHERGDYTQANEHYCFALAHSTFTRAYGEISSKTTNVTIETMMLPKRNSRSAANPKKASCPIAIVLAVLAKFRCCSRFNVTFQLPRSKYVRG